MAADIIYMRGNSGRNLVTMAGATRLLRYSVREMMLLTSLHNLPLPEREYGSGLPLYDPDALEKWKHLREELLLRMIL